MAKSRVHWIAVRVAFDRPCTKRHAVGAVNYCFKGADHYPDFEGDMPQQLWLRNFRANPPKGRR